MSKTNNTTSNRQLPPIPLMLADNQLIQRQSGSNCNVAVIGPPGCGKTHSILTPNLLLSTDCSLIVDDKKGVLYRKTRKYFKQHGYRILKFDTVNTDDCRDNVRFNPFALLRTRNDALTLANIMLPDELGTRDVFWLHSARALAVCLMEIGMHMIDLDPETKEFDLNGFFIILHAVGRNPDEDDSIDIVIEEHERMGLQYDSMEDYKMLKHCAESTWRSIVVTLEGHMQKFHTTQIMDLMSTNTISFTDMGSSKTILYVVNNDMDNSKSAIIQLLYREICAQLTRYADLCCAKYNNILPIPVRFLIDDFASGTRQADFENIIANCRSRNISYVLCFQSISQLRSLYEKKADGILDCLEYQVYFGTSNVETNQYLSNAANMPYDRVQRMRSDQVLVLHRCEPARLIARNRPEELSLFKESSLGSPSR